MSPKSTAKRKTKSTKTTKSRTTQKKTGISLLVVVIIVILAALIGGGIYLSTNKEARKSVCALLGIETEKRVYGIDLSRYQDKIEWDRLSFYYDTDKDTVVFEKKGAHLPISFVFIKATQGRAYDKSYEEKRKEARAHGYRTGAYHLFINDTNIVAQAQNFVNIAQLDSMDFPPILDVETKQVSRPYDKYREKVSRWLKIVEDKTGGKPLIYCSDKIREEVFNTPEFDNYHFWIARYDTTPPKSKDDWLFWQFTEKGKVKGIKGKVDVSIWKGTHEELETWRKSCWHDPKLREEIEEELDNNDAVSTPREESSTDTSTVYEITGI